MTFRPLLRSRLPLLAFALLAGIAISRRMPVTTVLAQTVTGDDIAAVMLDAQDLPGFRLVGDASPPFRAGETNEQRTRAFIANDTGPSDYTLLTILITVPNENAICLPYLPGNVANGMVLGLLNSDKVNFQRGDPPTIGEVATAASWSELDAGANKWLNIYSLVFMRGQVATYILYRTHAETVDPAVIEDFARRQDEKLIAATTNGSIVGLQAAMPVPPPPAETPAVCG